MDDTTLLNLARQIIEKDPATVLNALEVKLKAAQEELTSLISLHQQVHALAFPNSETTYNPVPTPAQEEPNSGNASGLIG